MLTMLVLVCSLNNTSLLLIQLMNYRSDRDLKLEINLDKICIASRNFEVKQMQGQIDSGDVTKALGADGPDLPSLQIGWQERVTLHYLVVPISNPTSFSTLSTLSFSGVSAATQSLQQTSNRCGAKVTDFICRERAHEEFSVSDV